MNVLFLYNSTQTYTSTVFEHISSFKLYSRYRSFFVHQDKDSKLSIDISSFDVVVIHYTIRLPFDQVSEETVSLLSCFGGLKVLFIQDEYDHTHRSWHWIKRLGIQLVFTVVPQDRISQVYPPQEFPGVRFVSVLTGYVPESIPSRAVLNPSRRPVFVGYRGRPLSIRYGALGREKVDIGKLVAAHCKIKGIPCDIEWTEEARIYGPNWYDFVASCRVMLGSESGSNVFDWDGSLTAKIKKHRDENLQASDDDVYSALIQPLEVPGLMNQISPRIFEAIALRTALVLFEGGYSGVVTPWVHYIPLKNDGSNIEEVFNLLGDDGYVDTMSERAYLDIIESGRYTYKSFVELVDEEIAKSVLCLASVSVADMLPHDYLSTYRTPSQIYTSPLRAASPNYLTRVDQLTAAPVRASPPIQSYSSVVTGAENGKDYFVRLLLYFWLMIPERARLKLIPPLKKIFPFLEGFGRRGE